MLMNWKDLSRTRQTLTILMLCVGAILSGGSVIIQFMFETTWLALLLSFVAVGIVTLAFPVGKMNWKSK